MKLHIIVGDVLPFFDVCIANSCRTRSPHLSCSSCCCCCIETSTITVPKESVIATPVNQLHHMTNKTNQATRTVYRTLGSAEISVQHGPYGFRFGQLMFCRGVATDLLLWVKNHRQCGLQTPKLPKNWKNSEFKTLRSRI